MQQQQQVQMKEDCYTKLTRANTTGIGQYKFVGMGHKLAVGSSRQDIIYPPIRSCPLESILKQSQMQMS